MTGIQYLIIYLKLAISHNKYCLFLNIARDRLVKM